MPFKSERQKRWAMTPEGTKALGGKVKVQEWLKATPKNIPKVAPKKKSK